MADQPVPSSEASAAPGRVFDRRRLPAGVVPKHLQQWVLTGTALVMVGILALSGPPAPSRPPTAPSPAATAVDPNQQRIEEYQRRIQEQAQRLAAEQAQLQLTKQALASDPDDHVGPGPRPTPISASAPMTSAPLPRDTSEDRAHVADNVVFSKTTGSATANSAPVAPASTTDPALALPMPPAVQPSAPPVGLPGLPGATSAPAPPAAPATVPVPPAHVATTPVGPGVPRYTLYEGTFIDTVLTNRLDGTFSGPVNCLVSVPVYASDHLVIPAGARVLGEARPVSAFGQSRLAVTFHRVLLPNGTHVSLDQFHGLNQIGDLGLRDQVDRHYAQIFGVSLALGAIAGLAQGRSAVGLDATALDSYRQGAAASVARSSTRVLDRFLNLLPTVTIREGHRIKVVLSQDLDVPAYPPAVPLPGGRP